MDVLAEAQEDAIYVEVQKALMAAAKDMPTANKYAVSYDAAELQKLVNTVKVYGGAATIFAAPEFIAKMGPDAIAPNVYAEADINAIHELGRIKMFRGTPVVELRQSFLDETNADLMINPNYAYILPAGKEKVVKVCLEGNTQMYDVVNPDQSIEVHTYKMIGVGIVAFNNWGVYRLTDGEDNDMIGGWYNPDALGLEI
jgi:hypothetical protein